MPAGKPHFIWIALPEDVEDPLAVLEIVIEDDLGQAGLRTTVQLHPFPGSTVDIDWVSRRVARATAKALQQLRGWR